MSRVDGRKFDELRKIEIIPGFMPNAEGSVLISCGNTKVICTASIEDKVPNWMKGKGEGWITAEYAMLPRATHTRNDREATKGKQGGRTLEIQRLIGRSLRAMVDMKKLGENTIVIDCDVIQADGGTRTAAITGSAIALVDALTHMLNKKMIKQDPLKHLIAAVSVGIVNGEAVLDLDYIEDSNCDTDMNVVMSQLGGFVEVQGTAEGKAFTREQADAMLALAETGIQALIQKQQEVLGW